MKLGRCLQAEGSHELPSRVAGVRSTEMVDVVEHNDRFRNLGQPAAQVGGQQVGERGSIIRAGWGRLGRAPLDAETVGEAGGKSLHVAIGDRDVEPARLGQGRQCRRLAISRARDHQSQPSIECGSRQSRDARSWSGQVRGSD